MREKPTKKRKRAETKTRRGVSPARYQAPTAVSDERDNSEERKGLEADSEQLVLSPIVDQGVPT